jgi:undecaprenyl diphosphate synthase
MDGNGRWARKRGLIRSQGHLEGLKAAKRIVKAASDMGIKYLSLYTFSTENWKRTASEVGFIMGLVKQYLRGELDFYKETQIRIRHAGDIAALPADIVRELADALDETKDFSGMQEVLALNYGGRDEIVRAVRKMECAMTGNKTENIGERDLGAYLDNPDLPDPDLIIRSAGEYRTSNFLIWQAAYSEWYFSEKLWPDWEKEDLAQALEDYQGRRRRFGGASRADSGE